MKRCQSVEVLSVNDRIPRRSAESGAPPPLPPKSEPRPLETILNTALANENVVVDDRTGGGRPAAEKSVTFRKSATPPEVSPTSMASLKRPFHKRRSSGLLFGVEERELPAPDTVKETRKIFESIDKTSSGSSSARAPFLTKSQSTSSLYLPASTLARSPSRDRVGDAHAGGRLARKKSDDNVNK
jgi:hypothetical protein